MCPNQDLPHNDANSVCIEAYDSNLLMLMMHVLPHAASINLLLHVN